MNTWRGDEAITVTFDLRDTYTPLRAALFFSGVMPAATLEASADGRTWSSLGETGAIDAGQDVLDVVIAAQGASPSRYVRLRFDAHGDKAFTLAEMEIWGREP